MTDQHTMTSLLGKSRLNTYLTACNNDPERAIALYQWATQMSGALHSQLSFVEIAVRNAIDPLLSEWNVAQGSEFTSEWTKKNGVASPLYEVIGSPLATARKHAKQEALRRHKNHHRGDQEVTHDDVLAQLMFGSWTSLIHNKNDDERRQKLWDECIHRAFPRASNTPESRIAIGKQLEILRRLRNRVAHHDNILYVDISHRFNGMLSILAKIDISYPSIAAKRSSIRKLNREDPRREWDSSI